MLRWLEQTSGSGRSEKRKEPEDENVDRICETKRRKFSCKWQTGRNWLVFDSNNSVMFCQICREYTKDKNKTNSFVVGTSNFKIEAVKDHEKARSHRESLQIKTAKTVPVEDSVAGRSLTSLKTSELEKMQLLFRNAHAIAKKGRPFTDFAWMCEVDRKKGLKIGETYTNDHQAKEFIHYIAEDERRKMKARLSDGKFISVMSDGSLDSAVMEEEMVYVRSASEGKVKVDFVGVKAVSKPDAAHIAEAVCSIMDSDVSTDWKNKLVAITTDGASVMTGVNNGVVTKLRGDRSSVLGIHCMAHKLELSFSDGIRKNVMVRKVEDLLSGLYTLYHKSGVNRASLKEHFRELHMKALMPTRIGGTRWLPHLFNALDHFLRGYAGIVHHLEEKSQDTTHTNAVLRAKFKGFLNIAKNGVVLRFCCLLHDTIYQLKNLSKSLQRSVSTLAEAQRCLSSTQAVIEKYKSRPGPKLRSVLDTDTYEGVLLKPSDAGQHDKAKNELIDSLCQCITARFSDVNSGVLHAMRLASFQCWPEADTSSDFGDEEINKLISHFRPLLLSAGVDVDLIPDQWTILKAELYTAGFSQGTIEKTWPTVNRMLRHRCPDILDLFDALLTIPASTADCERGFSVMKQVKSDWRSRLKGESLSDLLKTQLCSPDIKDFDPTKAINIWHVDGLRRRRPEFVRKNITKETSDSEEEASSESSEDI
ncbi:unnamed protein product [Knipowitschia caucasica]